MEAFLPRFSVVTAIDAIRDARADWFGAPERIVSVVLASHANPDGVAWASQPRLAEETSLSTRRVWSALSTLVGQRVLVVLEAGRQHRAARYSLLGMVEALRLATAASLANVQTRKGDESGGIQTRKNGSSDSQNRDARLAPVAREGTERGDQTVVAGATTEEEKAEPETAAGRAPEDGHRRVLETYRAAYARTHAGAPPAEITAADGRRAKELLERLGAEGAARAIDRWFSDAWRAEHQPSLRRIDPNACAAPAATVAPTAPRPTAKATLPPIVPPEEVKHGALAVLASFDWDEMRARQPVPVGGPVWLARERADRTPPEGEE